MEEGDSRGAAGAGARSGTSPEAGEAVEVEGGSCERHTDMLAEDR